MPALPSTTCRGLRRRARQAARRLSRSMRIMCLLPTPHGEQHIAGLRGLAGYAEHGCDHTGALGPHADLHLHRLHHQQFLVDGHLLAGLHAQLPQAAGHWCVDGFAAMGKFDRRAGRRCLDGGHFGQGRLRASAAVPRRRPVAGIAGMLQSMPRCLRRSGGSPPAAASSPRHAGGNGRRGKSSRSRSSSSLLTGWKRSWSKKRSSQRLPSRKSCVCRQRFHICRVRPTNW